MSTSHHADDGSRDQVVRAELAELCEAAAEGTLDADGEARLERLVTSDAAAAQFYAEYLHQHAVLKMIVGQPAAMPAGEFAAASSASVVPPKTSYRLRHWVRIGMLLASTAAAAWMLGLWVGGRRETSATAATTRPATVATIVSTKACRWVGASVPTENGAELPPGRLRLAEGVARLRFASGAEVSLEGPGELDLVSRDKCVLASGRLVASVPQSAVGFLVETSAAVLKDLGTEFGVNVRGPHAVDVAVFDGRVDVQERSSGLVRRITEGNTARVQDKQVSVFPSADETLSATATSLPTSTSAPSELRDPATRLIQISDALGDGQEAFILSGGPPKVAFMNPGTLQVKNVADPASPFHRKLYVAFDLAPLAGEQVLEADVELSLIATPFSSRFPDVTFAVYGISDESLDAAWNEHTVTWDNAPANLPAGAAVDSTKTVLLGKFTVEQGIQQGTFSVGGEALRNLLAADRNRRLSIIVVRETADPDPAGIIHGFASRHNPEAAPPTLKVLLRRHGEPQAAK